MAPTDPGHWGLVWPVHVGRLVIREHSSDSPLPIFDFPTGCSHAAGFESCQVR